MRLPPADIRVIIPAFNEEGNVGLVLDALPKDWVRELIVCDNGSTDGTVAVATAHGATVLSAPARGYGNACLVGIAHLNALPTKPDVVVFLDADHSDYPEELPQVVGPILEGTADLVIGSRALGHREKGSMTGTQKFGNWLSTRLIRLFYGVKFTDLGPFRAIRYDALIALQMRNKNFGWTVEMQIKAAKQKLRCLEVPVNYRRRNAGKSKVSGTVKGAFRAGHKILWLIFRSLFTKR